MATNLVIEFGGFGVDDINGLMSGANSGTIVLPEGTRFTMTADTFSSFADLTVIGTDKTAALTGTISMSLPKRLQRRSRMERSKVLMRLRGSQ